MRRDLRLLQSTLPIGRSFDVALVLFEAKVKTKVKAKTKKANTTKTKADTKTSITAETKHKDFETKRKAKTAHDWNLSNLHRHKFRCLTLPKPLGHGLERQSFSIHYPC